MGFIFLIDFPEDAHKTKFFLKEDEIKIMVDRVQRDRGDAHITPFNLRNYLAQGKDWKVSSDKNILVSEHILHVSGVALRLEFRSLCHRHLRRVVLFADHSPRFTELFGGLIAVSHCSRRSRSSYCFVIRSVDS